MAEQSLQQRQEQRQEQIIAPHQIQSLEYLMAQSVELEAKINKELEENPVLELYEPKNNNEQAEPDTQDNNESENNPPETSDNEQISADKTDEKIFVEENYIPQTEAENSDDKDEYDQEEIQNLFESLTGYNDTENNSFNINSPEAEEKRQHFWDSLSQEPSMQEQLLEQLRLLSLPKEKEQLVELVIGSIDENGYLKSHPADLATATAVDLKEIEDAIKIVQTFDPPGIGARNLQECLLLQLKAQGREKSKAAYLVKNHLDDLMNNRLPLIAKKMKLQPDELEKIICEIRKLNPKPGLALSSANPIFVVPEVFVERKGDKFIVRTNKDALPKLRISKTYMKMLEDPTTPKEVKTYIKEKIIRAKNLMKALSQRESTIKRIADVIVDEQYNFFLHGIDALKPLTMQQVADKLGLHETTVSRATTNKYMQTPFGLFEFKFFFSSGFKDNHGEQTSNKSVMEKIRDMIDSEDPASPLSDKDIAEELKKQGLNIARRTVAKYRESLGIPSSHLRKQHI